jgi:hypothetical protein
MLLGCGLMLLFATVAGALGSVLLWGFCVFPSLVMFYVGAAGKCVV